MIPIKKFSQVSNFLVFFTLVLAGAATTIKVKKSFAQEETKNDISKQETTNSGQTQGLAGQIQGLVDWIIRTHNLVPRPSKCEPPCYVLDTMTLSGSVDKNLLLFKITGGVIANEPVLVPLFGPPHEIVPGDIMINGKKAVVGFENDNFYFVRTADKFFAITGTMSIGGNMSFTISGPLNRFINSLEDGRVVEGNLLSGIINSTIHLEPGKILAQEGLVTQPPVFQVARAIRIQKEITFEYKVTLSSGSEVSSVTLPLPHGEVVLDVPGFKGWKQESSLLTVPTSGR